ncbi:SUMF1/EgtB/PvdO family nonheme iron enzyme [Thermoleptolyngbya oregonensis NK1-22]|uniref:SUMF1/EgtB/PvdO family nonheme iron enzyme n=1 Tax=Thermoleptolyngbya oregonensis NK1-22 TaxID=2547457 RepID=A0AA96Y6T8_9CYAN|nr:SUMF1/EgtB/PvdO family nonheme iron enzyme [Thermoleptolyngbya oregonensis NK1-22]
MPSLQSPLLSFIAALVLSTTVESPSVAQSSASPAPTAATAEPAHPIAELWQQHQVSISIGTLLLLSYLGVLGFRPLLLLRLPSSDLSIPYTSWKIPLGIVRFLKYRNRVLDAWVNQHWKTAQKSFLDLPTVSQRAIHIPLPVYLDNKPIETLTGEALRPTFSKNTAVLLITEEGGAGKTSLACQIALWGLNQQLCQHRLLPVLVETELDDKQTLFEVIRGQINALTDQRDPIAPELLENLLRRRRVLVIVDHLSEMGEETRKQITPQLADFPARALVVTSRLLEPLGNLPKTILKPLRIEGSSLSRFMDAYLEARNKRGLFEDEDYFNGCRRLSQMVGQRNITVLLARLYADQMIEQQEGVGGILPSSVPELMLSYLNQLNRSIEEANRRDNLAVQQDAQRIAWECLKQTYRPTTAAKPDIEKALSKNGANDIPARLAYLETRLRLVQTLEPGDKLRIVLDPLAEYLAALHWVDQCRENPAESWTEFLDSIDPVLEQGNDSPTAIQGFLLAVRDCCQVKKKEAQVPEDIPDLLARKAGLDPAELQKIEEKRRISLLISDLSDPDEEYRIRAAKDLGKRGLAAAKAVPNLLGMAKNPNQTLEARQEALKSLGSLGACSDSLKADLAPQLIALLQADHDPKQPDELAVRRGAAEALGAMKAGQAELQTILNDDQQPLTLRQGAARALGLIGAPSGQPVPMLIAQLRDGQVSTQVKPIPVYQEALPLEQILNLVKIPGGEFLMGSPPEEEGRDYYQYNLPETAGLDVEQQHRVTVPGFFMSQFPITQAQWRAVATALPPVNRELDPDPSNVSFKGGDRPVETISWYDAIEFCDRLSQRTSKTYRLPSEAEWEYACRAGTSSPFHIGDTLHSDLANYRATEIYGNGTAGIYRQKTTEVGSFGVNGFGLGDMHGNVYEWCLDHWHPTYERSPTDGSAWVTEGDDRYRLVRGGSWYDYPAFCRSASRFRASPHYRYNDFGFRVVCVFPWTQ